VRWREEPRWDYSRAVDALMWAILGAYTVVVCGLVVLGFDVVFNRARGVAEVMCFVRSMGG
jgi:hypothetical protein